MIEVFTHLKTEELTAGLDHIRRSPADEGVLELIVRRQSVDDREVLDQAELDFAQGLYTPQPAGIQTASISNH